MARMRILFAAFVMITVLLLLPVSSVLAEETGGMYSEDVPYLQGIDVELERNDGWKVFDGILTGTVDRQRSIGFINFKFDNLSVVDYTKYELVFDFELKSLLDDGSIAVYQHQHVNDIDEDNSPGFFYNLLISLSIKDDYFTQNFSYPGILNQSPYYQEKVTGSGLAFVKGLNSYNTIISRVDCFLKEKATGNIGLVSRFDFTWDFNFWDQCCTGISYKLIVPGTEDILSSQETQDSIFAGGLSSEGTSWFQDIQGAMSRFGEFIIDLPEVMYVLITNVYNVSAKLSELMKVVFPFFPSVILSAIAVLLIFSIIVAVWKFFKG